MNPIMKLWQNFQGLVDEAEYWSGQESSIEWTSEQPSLVYRWYVHVVLEIPGMRWLDIRAYAAFTIVRYAYGAWLCERFGHGDVQVDDFVAAERDERGRITDIDGGGVDWYCPRCGQGGRNWF